MSFDFSVTKDFEQKSEPTMYASEHICIASQRNGKKCSKMAMFEGQFCKTHARSIKNRKELPKNPNESLEKERKLSKHEASIAEAAAINKANGQQGKVSCTKLYMKQSVPDVDGYKKVFPIKGKHDGGYWCPTLSPMRMGPILHGQPGLPPARNLENLHQANKVFPSEVSGFAKEPTSEWFETRKRMYLDSTPHRHKEAALKGVSRGGKKNVPLYSMWRLENGTEAKFDYFNSRQFYCHFYEGFAKRSYEFAYLKWMHENGINLQIVGYDGRELTGTMEEMYLDERYPFGQELIIVSMLTINDPKLYPWNIHNNVKLPNVM